MPKDTTAAAGEGRPNPGQFKPGPDPCRHRFTREECIAGFWAALESYTLKGGEPRYFLKRRMEARGQVFRHIPKSERGRITPERRAA